MKINGRPRTLKEVKKFIVEHPYLTDMEIAKKIRFELPGIAHLRKVIENEK